MATELYPFATARSKWQDDYRLRDTRRRFWRMVNKGRPDQCWPWRGAVLTSGYGVFNPGRDIPVKATTAHRFAYEMEVNGVPEDQDVKQRCRNKLCVNYLSHLYVEHHGKRE